MRKLGGRMTRDSGYGRGSVALQSIDTPQLDRRCSANLYYELLAAAKLVQQNEHEKAREKALSAFGIIDGKV